MTRLLLLKKKSKFSSEVNMPRIRDLYEKILDNEEGLSAIIKFIKNNSIKSIASIGSDYPIQEYYINKKTGVKVLCFDFDNTVIKNSEIIFNNKISVQFYDMNTPLSNIIEQIQGVDCIIFFKSLYIFNSNQYSEYLREVSSSNIRYIIDCASVTPLQLILRSMISNLIKFPVKTSLFKFFPNSDRFYIGKFHGYSRTKSSLLKIYNNSNFKMIKSFKNYFFLENS